MKFVLGIIVAGFMFTAAPARAQDADKVTKAEAAALAWLALTDAGDYPRSWDQAAGYFQASISKPIGSTPLAMYGSPWAASYRARSDPPNTRARFRAHPMGSTSSFNMTLSSRPRMAQSKRSRRFWKRTAHGRFPG